LFSGFHLPEFKKGIIDRAIKLCQCTGSSISLNTVRGTGSIWKMCSDS
jgi:hypothetical protein